MVTVKTCRVCNHLFEAEVEEHPVLEDRFGQLCNFCYIDENYDPEQYEFMADTIDQMSNLLAQYRSGDLTMGQLMRQMYTFFDDGLGH